MKNPKGRLGLAVKKIPCKSCFALTGTLMQNRMEEMWSVLDFVSQHLRLHTDCSVNAAGLEH